LDDDTATALGIRLGRTRLGLVAVGVVLASMATGAAGPVDFVALLGPQIARRLTWTAQIPLFCSALLGAVIVVLGDLLASKLLATAARPLSSNPCGIRLRSQCRHAFVPREVVRA